MVKREDLAYILYAKVNRDFDDFEIELLGSPAEAIIERTYEIADKGYILAFFEDTSDLSAEQIVELLKLDDTLDACYEAWKATGSVLCPYKIKAVITAFADYLIEKSAEADTGGHKV